MYQWNKDRTKGYKLVIETINLEIRRGLAYRNGQILSTYTWIRSFPVALRSVYKEQHKIIASDYKHQDK